MSGIILGRLASGQVVFDRPNSHMHKSVRALLPEIFKNIYTMEPFMVYEYVFDRVIGLNHCVETGAVDEIIFALRSGRRGPTRFVKKRKPEPTNKAVVILKQVEDGYILITAFVGPRAEREPWEADATEKERTFWRTHALIYGSEEIVAGSETQDCPW